jgi:hypothetical protein
MRFGTRKRIKEGGNDRERHVSYSLPSFEAHYNLQIYSEYEDYFVAITSDQNIVFYNMETLKREKQGYRLAHERTRRSLYRTH